MKPKLIVLESADNLGKSSVSKIVAEKLNAKLLIAPSDTNSAKMLRKIVKEDPCFEPFERQCLHTMTHIVDFYEEFDGKQSIVMDRCHLSALVYGRAQGIPDNKLQLLYDLHFTLAQRFIDKYDVTIVGLTRHEPFSGPDDSIYETTVAWHEVNDFYKDFIRTGPPIFCKSEMKALMRLKDEPIQAVAQNVLRVIR